MEIEKVVILAGGVGSRMRSGSAAEAALSGEAARMADSGLKGLMPIQGRPFLDFVVGSLLEAGLRRLCLVVPPEGDLLRQYASRTSRLSGAEITCAVQPEPRGTADAALAAEGFVGADSFVLCNCDTVYPAGALRDLCRPPGRCCYVVAFDRDQLPRGSNFGPERVNSFAVLIVSDDGALERIIEKPREPERYVREGKLWLGLNLFRFTPEVFDACRRTRPNAERGELELTDAVSLLLAEGAVPFRVIFSSGGVVDLTGRGDVATARRLLEGRSPAF